MGNSGGSFDSRINGIWVKVIGFLVAVLVAIGSAYIGDMSGRVSSLEDRVSYLQHDKVGRAEFREEMNLIRAEINTNNQSTLASLASTKKDLTDLINILIENSKGR